MATNSHQNFKITSLFTTEWTQQWLAPWYFMTEMASVRPRLLEIVGYKRRDVSRAQLEGRPRRATTVIDPDYNLIIQLDYRTVLRQILQSRHQVERGCILASLVTSRISP